MKLFLAGDLMTGRGIDQVLSNPSDPALYESHAHDARDYVTLAERVHGKIRRPVSDAHVWGTALAELRLEPASRADAEWLKAMLERESLLDRGLELAADNSVTLRI